MRMVELRSFCHSRAGDKGNNLTLSLIVFRHEDYHLIAHQITSDVVASYFGSMIKGPVERFEMPRIGALNFFVHNVLGGGSTKALRRDIHGKALSGPFLDMEIEVSDDFEPAMGPY
jgi:hypothetical protein